MSGKKQIIGLCGAACTGKTSVASWLNEHSAHIATIPEGARSIDSDTGLGGPWQVIDTIGIISVELYFIGQWRLLDLPHLFSDRISTLVTDTTPLDNLAYCHVLGDGHSEDVLQFITRRALRLLQQYDEIFLFPRGVFPFAIDDVRTRDTQVEHEEKIIELSEKFDIGLHVLESKSIEERGAEILARIS